MVSSLIVLTGKKRSGKDTVAKILEDLFGKKNSKIISLATPLKKILSRTLGIPVNILDTLKNTESRAVMGKEMRNVIIDLSDAIMEQTGDKDIWCRLAAQKIDYGKINIVTDMRFIREHSFFKSRFNKFTIIRVTRPKNDGVPDDIDTNMIPVDHTINNDGSLEDLEFKVAEILYSSYSEVL